MRTGSYAPGCHTINFCISAQANTVNSLFSGKPSGPRVSGNLFQSNFCDPDFCQGFSCCPFCPGVRNAEVPARGDVTVFHTVRR